MLTHNDIIAVQDMLDDIQGIVASFESHFSKELEGDLKYHNFDSVEDVDDSKLLRHFEYLQRKLASVEKMQRKLQRVDAILTNSVE